jgi:hypothetical protein
MVIKTTQTIFKVVMLSGIAAGLLLAQPVFAIGKPAKRFTVFKIDPEEGKPAKKTKTTVSASRNNSAVKIYPDIIKRSMHVVAKENAGKEVDFFVFDLQGTLVQNYKMKAKDHIKIVGLARGSYIYRVFNGDEETAAGKFEIR